MRKILNSKNIVSAVIFTFFLLFVNIPIKAYTHEGITSLNVETGNLQITVSGTTDDDVHAISISVYESDGSTLVKMKTSSVDDENKYSEVIPLDEGTYVIKVADYEGGQVVSKENVVVEKSTNTSSETQDINETIDKENTDVKETIAKDEVNADTSSKDNKEYDTSDELTLTSVIPENPPTLDNILIFVAMFTIGLFGLFVTVRQAKRAND